MLGQANDSLPTTHTVMTYNGEHRLYGIDPMPYDILAMEFIYGEGEASNTGDDTYDIDPGVVDSFKTEIGQATEGIFLF